MKPGVPLGTRIAVSSFFTEPSARTLSPVTAVMVTRRVILVPELVMNCLVPLMTHWPSSRTAVVLVPAASEPASASVSPKAASAVPCASIGSHSCFCASVPLRNTGIAPSPTPASSVTAMDWSTRASCSTARQRST